MQTTLRINDEIFRNAKAEAARVGVTLTRYIEDALQERMKRTKTRGNVRQEEEINERNRLMEQLLQATAHFKVGSHPTREEMNAR
jgi:hypothetical protein